MPENFIRGDGKPAQRIYRVSIPQTELWESVEDWNPEDYDPKKWMDAAAKAGFKYSPRGSWASSSIWVIL